MTFRFSESTVELAAIDYFRELGYSYLHGEVIAPDGPAPERVKWSDVILEDRLRKALARVNPHLPSEAHEQAARRALVSSEPGLFQSNRAFHKALAGGVDVEYRNPDGRIRGDKCWLVDFVNPALNDWLVVNQMTVVEGQIKRRPDVVLFVNGIPLGLFEFKNPGDENATVKGAYNQLRTYIDQVPRLFHTNELLVISDGTEARLGTISSGPERFAPWKTIDGSGLAADDRVKLQVLVLGVFEPRRFLDLIRNFLVFDVREAQPSKKLAGYHQFHAVNKAVEATIRASRPTGDRRAGVVWHTQGSGKSLSMVFFAGKLIRNPVMENPTLVLLTDRNDLDEQLHGEFAASPDLIPPPQRAESRAELRELLTVASGGVVFTTIQKFLPPPGEQYPMLSNRRNIVVIADEAHRSQYDFIDGFAHHMRTALPNATFIGFTGTPIELSDRSTPAVFGDYIDVYDVTQAVLDGATVPIYYEGRLARIDLDPTERPNIDPDFEEVTEAEEEQTKRRLKSKWARQEALVGAGKRIGLVAQDLVDHWEKRLEANPGKGMVVCMSRRICVQLYDAIVALRPEWDSNDDESGVIKVVMTGSAADDLHWQRHIRNSERMEKIKARLRNPDDPLRLVIVRDMWLTGFDAPPLHTMYVDKPMRGHGLMQAIARVNRVFGEKQGGLIVDYIGIAENLKRALADYSERDRGETGIPQEQAVALFKEKFEVAAAILYRFDHSKFLTGKPSQQLAVVAAALEHILAQEDGKSRFIAAATAMSRAFALAVPADDALALREEVAFLQVLRAALLKGGAGDRFHRDDLDLAVGQIVSRAITSGEVLDIFSAAGLAKPNISVLSDAFLAEVRGLPHKNLAVEALERLLNEEIKARSKTNVVQARTFAEKLEEAIRAYQNRTVEAAKVIEELIQLARDMREAAQRGERLGLHDDELAFYDALASNESAIAELGDEALKKIARELVESVRHSVTIDWNIRESVRAGMRARIKRLLRKHGYPPDKTEGATQLVLEQAEVLSEHWPVSAMP
ncbi:MAG TPA: DEAD/DEAH box helicase [Chloroflexi bacterium]|jgi:type I restriction enzyme R subunit|nr:DEAD/DEAH box helicase [Chloroflexota bacterium]